MLSLHSSFSYFGPSTKYFKFSANTIPSRVLSNLRFRCYSSGDSNLDVKEELIANFAGVKLDDAVDVKAAKLRLDSWISSRVRGISRARVQSSIRSGLVTVNGRMVNKVNFISISCIIEVLI